MTTKEARRNCSGVSADNVIVAAPVRWFAGVLVIVAPKPTPTVIERRKVSKRSTPV
jgi:hypothetical protein